MSNVLGNNIQFEIFGESHGPCIGGVLAGVKAGTQLDMERLHANLQKRRPGSSRYVTSRVEADAVEFLSGLLDGVTTGAPIAFVIKNTSQHSKDYDELKRHPRPSHADYTAHVKYGGYQDVRGGGHFSGRLTAAIVVAGTIAEQINELEGIAVFSHLKAVGSVVGRGYYSGININELDVSNHTPYNTLTEDLHEAIEKQIQALKDEGDSTGGLVETIVTGLPIGLGDPFFGSIESQLASALYAIPGVKGLEFGRGFELSYMKGSQANDPLFINHGIISMRKNDSGGVNGGITNGQPLVFTLAFRPTASISLTQETVNLETLENATLVVGGRHDPAFVLRTPVVVKAMTHLVLLDIRSKR